MNLERRMAEEATRPDKRAVASVQQEINMPTQGIGTGISNPNAAGIFWWQIGVPTITLGTHPHPLPR